MIRKKTTTTTVIYKYWISDQGFYREDISIGAFERWNGRVWCEVLGAEGTAIVSNGTVIKRAAAKELYPKAIRGVPAKNRSALEASWKMAAQPADFSDPESQRVLAAAALAVVYELGREAGREYFAELISKQKAAALEIIDAPVTSDMRPAASASAAVNAKRNRSPGLAGESS